MRSEKPRRVRVLWFALVLLSLLWPGVHTLAQPPSQSDLTNGIRPVTWNLQRRSANWGRVRTLAQQHPVIALQEVSATPPAMAQRTGRIFQDVNGNINPNLIEYWWNVGTDAEVQLRFLYILLVPDNNTVPGRRTYSNSMAFVLNRQATNAVEVPSWRRPALLVEEPEHHMLFATLHAQASRLQNDQPNDDGGPPVGGNTGTGGYDVPTLLRDVNQYVTTHYPQGSQDWTMLGDFNQDPDRLRDRVRQARTTGTVLPGTLYLRQSNESTHRSGSELDYLVTTLNTSNWEAGVNNSTQGSDHWPVEFGTIQASAEAPQRVTIESGLSNLVLDAGANSRNGSLVNIRQADGSPGQKWNMVRLTRSFTGGGELYRIVNADSQECLDVARGIALLADCHMQPPLTPLSAPNDPSQEFVLEHVPGDNEGVFRFRNLSSGMVLYSPSTVDGSRLGPHPASNQDDPAEFFFVHPEERD